ncbi:MAG: hypothetical protein CMO55_15275 [Verrucomicrobiales bacterium]|nr:hypothetical protein [Verrucomicrobiales bacterium]
MKLSFETVVLVFVVTLIHIGAIALMSPVQDFEWEKKGEENVSVVDQVIEDAISSSENSVADPVEHLPADLEETVEEPKITGDRIEKEEPEPVALVNSDEFRDRVLQPELVEAGRDAVASNSDKRDKPVDTDSQDNTQASNFREVRQITPIPRS